MSFECDGMCVRGHKVLVLVLVLAADDDVLEFLLREVKKNESMQRIEIMNRPTPIPMTSHTFRPSMLVFFDSSWFRSFSISYIQKCKITEITLF